MVYLPQVLIPKFVVLIPVANTLYYSVNNPGINLSGKL